jgi:GNAT superfamily N-acetyltransferase
MAWEVVAYTHRRRPAVLALMAEVQGHTTSRQRFIWEFEHNPIGDINVYLAVEGDEVIGVSCHNTYRMRLHGRDVVVSFPLNVLTKAEHRGRGIFSRLERENEEHAAQIGAAAMLSFPNAASTPIFLGRLGWLALSAPRLVARPRSLLRHRPHLPLSLEPATTVDTWVDEIWAENHDLDRCMVRDSTYLNWRFAQCPDANYHLFLVRDRHEIVGYVITGTSTKRGIPIAYVANALLVPSWRNAYPDLRRAALGDARVPVLLDLETPLSAIPGLTAPVTKRYLPLRKRLNLIAKPLRNPFNGPWLGERPWFFQLGDLDFF